MTETVATMDKHPHKGKGEPSAQTRNTGQDPETSTDSQVFQPGEANQIQPLEGTENGAKTWENYFISVGANYQCEDGQLPPIWTFLNNRLPSADVGRGGDCGFRSQTVTSGFTVSELPSGDQVVPLQATQSLDTPQVTAAGEPMEPDPVHLITTSPGPGGDGATSGFTIPPLTEEASDLISPQMSSSDLRQMQPGQDENGYIKRPMNAFMVFSHIHRSALRETCLNASMIETSVKLGSEWSKLSQEQQRPYYEVARKLKCMHKQQFPDYEFRPQRKKNREYLFSEQGGGQGAGQEPGIYFSQPVPQLGPSIYASPIKIPCTVGYYPYPFSCQYHPMGLYSRVKVHCPRFFYRCPNTNSSSMEEVKNYHDTHLQGDETALDALAREHHPAHEALAGSTAPPESLQQPDTVTSQQLPASNKVECNCEDDVDVVGLL